MRNRPRNTITSCALQDSSWKDAKRLRFCGLGVMVCISNPSLGKQRRKDFKVKASLDYLMRPYQKQSAIVIHACNPSNSGAAAESGAQGHLFIHIASLKLAYAVSKHTKAGAEETAINNVFTG